MAQAGEIVQSVKTIAPIGKNMNSRGNTLATMARLLCPLPLCYPTAPQTTLNTTGYLWPVPVSPMLGSKYQITETLWARRAQVDPGQAPLATGPNSRDPIASAGQKTHKPIRQEK